MSIGLSIWNAEPSSQTLWPEGYRPTVGQGLGSKAHVPVGNRRRFIARFFPCPGVPSFSEDDDDITNCMSMQV